MSALFISRSRKALVGVLDMTITPVYAALLGFLFIALSIRVIRLRRTRKVAIGAKGDPAIERAMRVHANFAEYTPFALLLIAMLELKSAGLWIHILGAALLAGRALHAYGVSRPDEDFRFRVTGMSLTFGVIGLASAGLLLTTL